MCHVVLALPVVGLTVFLIMPFPLAASSYLIVLAVSAGLYWVVLDALDRPLKNGIAALVDERGKVVEANALGCRVESHAEVWWAVSSSPVHVGQTVKITGGKGLKLEIEPLIKGKERGT